jgi:site-specific recombinase XerD
LESCGVYEVAAVTEEHLAEYALDLRGRLSKRQGRPLSDSYIARSLRLARTFLVWARAQGHVLLDFSSFPVNRPLQKLKSIPTVAQVSRLLDAPGTDTPEGLRDALIIEFFYTLGVRSRECIRLDVGHVDLSAGTVRVMGKGSRERLLPMSPRLAALVTRYLRDGRPNLRPHHDESALWIAAQTGRRLMYSTIKQRLARWGDLQGLKVHPHLLRHACATHLLEAGAEPEHIQQLLGHKRASSTELYAQVRPSELAAEHERSHPRAR